MNDYTTGVYWARRKRLLYYRYFDELVRRVGSQARSLLDVGSGNAPYLDEFWWIPERVSIDIAPPYQSHQVTGIRANVMDYEFGRRFDLVTCMQVLEHVPDAEAFAHRLLSLAPTVLVSVPYRWESGTVGHVHDPVDEAKLAAWFGRQPNWSAVVTEPFGRARLFSLYDADAQRDFTALKRRGTPKVVVPKPGVKAAARLLAGAIRRRLVASLRSKSS